ncbi:MAG TPA: glycosyltransferase [Solirubrobacteraceae bacterium]|nr:glycosyltransferase [Solirubrobacteraceae bacterium]
MRILVFHGYLLGGTGSNVYNARLAEAFVRLGHDVHLLCQERHPEEHAFLSTAVDWDEGELRLRPLAGHAGAGPGQATMYRPNIGGLLPVYVADRYEGVRAVPFAECTPEQVDAYVGANVAAVAEVAALARPELALANHLVMGPLILARGLDREVPYAVKVHGSALEYTVKPNPGRFLEPAREGIAFAQGVLVGSHHTAASLWATIADPSLPERTRLGPPGVDVARFAPRDPAAAAAGVRALAARLADEPARPVRGREASAFDRDPAEGALALERLAPEGEPLVAYVGKLIVSKGVELLLAAWPLVLERASAARLVVVGFGAYREGLEQLLAALAAGELERARTIALQGRALEGQGAPAEPLRQLLAFLEQLDGERRERYLAAAAALGERVVFTGRLEHEELAELLPACRALVAPSTFPEAFGMVAAEAAACAAVPIVARHSGLAEVAEALASEVPPQARGWLSFPVDDDAVEAIAERVTATLEAPAALLAATREGLVAGVRERWSWERVAEGVIAAAQGRLDELARP